MFPGPLEYHVQAPRHNKHLTLCLMNEQLLSIVNQIKYMQRMLWDSGHKLGKNCEHVIVLAWECTSQETKMFQLGYYQWNLAASFLYLELADLLIDVTIVGCFWFDNESVLFITNAASILMVKNLLSLGLCRILASVRFIIAKDTAGTIDVHRMSCFSFGKR